MEEVLSEYIGCVQIHKTRHCMMMKSEMGQLLDELYEEGLDLEEESVIGTAMFVRATPLRSAEGATFCRLSDTEPLEVRLICLYVVVGHFKGVRSEDSLITD